MANTVKKPLLYKGDKIVFSNTYIHDLKGHIFHIGIVELTGVIDTPEGKVLEMKHAGKKTTKN